MDELHHWLEVRISSSLRPRTDDIKSLLLNHKHKSCLSEFLKNEDVHTLYVYFKLAKASLAASVSPPPALHNKCICFLKLGKTVKLTLENIGQNVLCVDCARFPLKYFDTILHQVYLPLLCNDGVIAGETISADKVIDLLHRFSGNLEVLAGHAEGSIVLPMPSIELLRNPSLFSKHGAAIHVMETTVIGWVRQIKFVLKHDPLTEIKTHGSKANIYHEESIWNLHIHNLQAINTQLISAQAMEIVSHLEQAESTYGSVVTAVRRDVTKALSEAKENLAFLKALLKWFDLLKSTTSASERVKNLLPMLHCLLLVWTHSRYYHQRKVFLNLLKLMSNEIVKVSGNLLGTNILGNSQANSDLKEALKLCGTFRGTYLDIKIKADRINTEKNEEHDQIIAKQSVDNIWNVRTYRQLAPKFLGKDWASAKDKMQGEDSQELWVDSPWPPHNAKCFNNMNLFMERCNDVLDLVDTMKHFQILKSVVAIGGAGTSSLDAMVQDIWESYRKAEETFVHQITDIITTDKNSPFEKEFFDFRTTIKDLEHQLGGILRSSFDQCPNIASQLRLLEVFEGISRRDIVKDHLMEKDQKLVSLFIEELTEVQNMYSAAANSPPLHINMTPTLSKLLWIRGLKARISDPMGKLKTVSALTLEGDMGWKLRHFYTDLEQELERYENSIMTSWLTAASKQLSNSIKLPLLRAAGLEHEHEEFLCKIELNHNAELLVCLREAEYLLKPPFMIKLPESTECLVKNLHLHKFTQLSARLETVVSKYNEVMKSITYHQRSLFEKKLLKSQEILKEGMGFFTWGMDESEDYAELVTSCVCTDLYTNFSIVTNNYKMITQLTAAWCTANLDIFTCRDKNRSYSITELIMMQKKLEQEFENILIPDGQKIHSLVHQSLFASGISEASPAWQDYIMHIDSLVLQGLKKVTITSLASMLNTLLETEQFPILCVGVQLVNSEVSFTPPLDCSTSEQSIIENIEEWLKMFLLRGSHVQGFSSAVKGGYQQHLSEDEEALQLIGHILQQVEKCLMDCQEVLKDFNQYTHLWKKDVNSEFQNFLHGTQTVTSELREGTASGETGTANKSSVAEAEQIFILPRDSSGQVHKGPLLHNFDSEIAAYEAARDSIQGIPDVQNCQWVQVDLRPIKQVLTAYALKWMWTFTKYLIDQTSTTLRSLDSFLKSTEPQIESITGEERDTGSFMKMMRLFNKVSAKQVEMDVQFAVLQRTVTLLAKHSTQLPPESDVLFRTMPARWNSMKTKVSLAKQRLGPRIQQEADRVTRDLERFQHKLDALGADIETSAIYTCNCTSQEAFATMQNFNTRVQMLQNEAKDLKELQELLESTVIDFSILTNCEDLLRNLQLVWLNVDSILKEQAMWKSKLWQNMETEELYKKNGQQLKLLQSLPREVQEWDVYKQTLEAVNSIHMTLPLIEDLSNPAMRTRHWKQLVRQTGGMLRVTADSLKAVTLGDLLAMDLQKHTGDVKTIVQRAIQDVTIESSLKNCEEVWLSRIFDLRPHSRVITAGAHNEEIASSVSGSHYTKGDSRNIVTGRGSRRMSRQSDKGFYLSRKGGRGSTMSLYESLKNIEEHGTVMLLRNTDAIFEELEHHQLLLTTMRPYAEAGSFLDELYKWHKKLQVIETTVQLWLSVQEKWTQLEEVFSTLPFRVAMPREAVLFADVHHHFCRLMKSVEDNPNILQTCMRRGLESLLDMLNYKLERCQRAVRLHLEQKRLAFPRLFFLSVEDTLNIVCYGYDLNVLSSYIMKIFPHILSLIIYTSEPASENFCPRIIGLKSFLMEDLYLTEPLECRGPVECWLSQLVDSIKVSLQNKLREALEHTKTFQWRRKEIHSAGARRVVINKEPEADERSASSLLSDDGEGSNKEPTSRHWTLCTLSDVAFLSTQIRFTKEMKETIGISNEHSKEKLQHCLKDLTEGIEYSAKTLNEIPQKGILQKSKRTSKAEKEGNGQDEQQRSELLSNNISDSSEKQEESQTIIKTSLSACDTVKLANHILLLLYQRDVMQQYFNEAVPKLKLSHHLSYEYDDNGAINVRIGDSEILYGYEYQGPSTHMLITPLTERIFFSVMSAVSSGIEALCASPQGRGKRSTVRELCMALGKPLFHFNCTERTDYSFLQDVSKGLAAAGAWISISGLEQLPQSSLTLLAQLLEQIQSARHCGKESVTLQLDEVPLNPAGACIAIINRPPYSTWNWNESPQPSNLPHTFLNNFRIVGVCEVPVIPILEAQLLLKGFSNVSFLAQKLNTLLESFTKVCQPSMLGAFSTGGEKHPCLSACGITNLLAEAGERLKSLQRAQDESEGQELTCTDKDGQVGIEEKAIIVALYHFWLPQISEDVGYMLKCLVSVEWPHALNFLNSLNKENKMDGPLSAIIDAKYAPRQQVSSSECAGETSVPSAIIKAAEQCHIFPSNAFVSKVSHLVQLTSKFQTVVVTGPSGCGKTHCIKTCLETLKVQGKKVTTSTIFINALQPGHLMGCMNNEWIDGLLPKLLRLLNQHSTTADINKVDVLHLDGEVDHHQMEFMQSILCGADVFVAENNERIRIPDSLQLFLELDSLSNLSPSVLSCMGILAMTRSDVNYKLPLYVWIKSLAEEHQQLLHQLTETFLEPSLQFLRKNQILLTDGDERNGTPRTLFLSEANVVQTFCRISKSLMQHIPEMIHEDIKKYFMFACIWSFGSWLDSNEKRIFSNWWRRVFRHHNTFPLEGQVWDYHVDTDTRQFVRWHDTLSSYYVSHGQGMASEAFVHTLQTEQLLYLSSLLTTSGCPVMLAGNGGCGKTAIVRELLNSLCSGDVAEMLALRIPINASTDSKKLWGCLKERLEWQHGTLHTPSGNKKLLCLLDDLNLAKVDEFGRQPACELIRQLLDHEQIFDPTSLKLKTIKYINYLATWNLTTSERLYAQRLLRHFCIFNCQYPSQSDQHGIFSSLLSAHFMQPATEFKAGTNSVTIADHLQGPISSITAITIELQERLRTVFLRTYQRCHYIFTLRDLAKIFRNICLSLDGSTTAEKILRLWRHECDWVYGHKMSSSVDYSRYQSEYAISVKKVFTNEEELHIILSTDQPLFSNIIEDDGGLITTVAKQQDSNLFRRSEKTSITIHTLDGYQQTFNLIHTKQLLAEALREYNKANPRMNITFYKSTVDLLCRLTRNIGSTHESAHTMLCGEGCPRATASLARLAAHLSGFSVVQIGSYNKAETEEQQSKKFRSQLVDCYVKAGLKGQKIMILLAEEEIDDTTLVQITEFIVFGSVSHLFTSEQQATIANAMRSEVTSAGLTYSKERSWGLFLQAVQQNIRWFLIYSRTESTFYKWCLEFSSLMNSINVYFIPHWSSESLVEHASYHIQDLDIWTEQEKENVCHLLSSMHLSVIKHDKLAQVKYGTITNETFEKFVHCFRAMVKNQHAMIMVQHQEAKKILGQILEKLKSHEKLTGDLQHQRLVLEEHNQGTLKILYQIAQDKAVVEQKILSVHQQLQKIQKFQRLLPEYQAALEKAQYKCYALLEYIKELVKDMNIKELGELRAMQKPDVDIEELMASIIIILKSPNTDLTWAKGAKRQMANIDRFLNELLTFSTIKLPQSTLELLENNIKKAQFTPENMERKAGGNLAVGTLMRWLQAAVHYYRILTSKVKPLQGKVEEMTVALEEAEQKMTSLQQRKNALISRLSDLEKGFEEATVHKNQQQQKTTEISKRLEQADNISKILEEENKTHSAIVNSLVERLQGILGSTAMAAGLLSYLGAYEHDFRQFLLTVEWPMALKERGFPLMIDSVDPVKGHVIEFSVIFNCESPRKSQKLEQKGEVDESESDNEKVGWQKDEEGINPNTLSPHKQFSPIITEELYGHFIKALLLRMVKRTQIQKWVAEDLTPQQMENSAILSCSWQQPVLLVDPSFEGEKWIKGCLESSQGTSLSSIDLQPRQDNSVLAPIEKTLLSGRPLMLQNYSRKWDDLLMPLLDHCSANADNNSNEDISSIISFNGHRLLCSDQFKLYLEASELEPNFNIEISAGTTIINYSSSEGSLLDLLLRRAFAKLQPDLHSQLMKLAADIVEHQKTLNQLEERARDCLLSSDMSIVNDTINIAAVINEKKRVFEILEITKSNYQSLMQARDSLYPLAHRGSVFYFILKSLRSLAAEYYFNLESFLRLFDAVIGAQADGQALIKNEDVTMSAAFSASNQENDCRSTSTEDILPAPQGTDLSSSVGAHYPSLSSNQITKVMDQLTRAVYQRMIQCLLPEHSVQACALLLLRAQQLDNEDAFTEEELAFFAHDGDVFEWKNTDSNLIPPSWMPQERWNDLMALSLVSSPLRTFSMQVAEHSLEWGRWYKTDCTDINNKDEAADKDKFLLLPDCGEASSEMTDFQSLLILRAMRPDKFPAALSYYVSRLASDLVYDDFIHGIDDIAKLEEDVIGVLVIMPCKNINGPSYGGAVFNHEPKISICNAAKQKGIPLFVASMKDGKDEEVKEAINEAMNRNGWLIIEDLQVASKNMLKNLCKSLKYATKMQVSQNGGRQFCVWLTSEPGAAIPKHFLARLKKVSWHILVSNQKNRKPLLMDVTYTDSLSGLLYSAILSAVDQVNEETNIKLKESPTTVRNICYGICVLHGILQTQKIYPMTGMNHIMDVGPLQLNQAIDAALSAFQKDNENEEFAGAVEEGVSSVYGSLFWTLEDVTYVHTLVQEVISASREQQGSLEFSHLTMSFPPENVEPSQYSNWLISQMHQSYSVNEFLLLRDTEKSASKTYVSEFMHSLSSLYDALKGVLPMSIPGNEYSAKELAVIRALIETVSEQLPPLIQITEDESFINKFETPGEQYMINQVLLQECNQMNSYIKYIKTVISELLKCLLSGLSHTPNHLKEAADALLKYNVPRSWLYPNYSYAVCLNISSWLQDLDRKSKQLKQWLQKGLMPFVKDEKGVLTSISPGGMFNPEALFLALRTEFAFHHGYSLHKVVLQCHISEHPDYKPELERYQLYLQKMILQGAGWDFKNNCIKESSNLENPLPFVIISPTLLENVKSEEEGGFETYKCPVYMDKTMKNCVTKFPLLCTTPLRQWKLRRVAIILNSELDVTSSHVSFSSKGKEMQAHFPMSNRLTKMGKSSHVKIFNRTSEREESLATEPQIQKESTSNGVQNDNSQPLTKDNELLDAVDENKEPVENSQSELMDKAGVRDSSLFINQTTINEEIKDSVGGDIVNSLQNASVSEGEDHRDQTKRIMQEKDFTESEAAKKCFEETVIRESSIMHTSSCDYDSVPNEAGLGHNNGGFDETESHIYQYDFTDDRKEMFEENMHG
ncbi:dynein beta chain, flagellar outer arm [Xenopus laevis]|uniref:Dynein beta chain, flagellar outer arm n=2 Tax=Xenopus laevis TaxID=8355 RepID=A0A8J0UE78_XENLA|nr:dynein beta chain, flagellar outer arm [Xenopus laevis]